VKEGVAEKGKVVGRVEVGWEMVVEVKVLVAVGKEVALGRVGRGRAGRVVGREVDCGGHHVKSAAQVG
jgi:hypothetical protein